MRETSSVSIAKIELFIDTFHPKNTLMFVYMHAFLQMAALEIQNIQLDLHQSYLFAIAPMSIFKSDFVLSAMKKVGHNYFFFYFWNSILTS